MKRYKKYFAAFLSLAALFSIQGCVDDALYNSETGNYEGPVSLTLNFEFEPINVSDLGTRGVPGNLDFAIRDLKLFFYDSESDPTDNSPRFIQVDPENISIKSEERDQQGISNEELTYQGIVKIEDIQSGSYRIYAVANVTDDVLEDADINWQTITEESLRALKIKWPEYQEPDASSDLSAPSTYSVPDAMFGYFTVEGTAGHSSNKNNLTDAPTVTLNQKNQTIQAWLKRTVSKLNIGFDGTELNDDVEIYIKSVKIVNAPTTCPLGQDNAVDGKEVVAFSSDEAEKDERLYHEYSDDFRDSGESLSKGLVFPRQNVRDNPDSEEWQAFVFGNADNPNPKYKSQPTTLYFFENIQGTGDKTSEKVNDEKKPNATYVEVTAYYKKMAGAASDDSANGIITYRFMLGKNTTNDFNAARNYHYRLTLRLKNDARTPEWSLDFEQVQNVFYFRIPYNPTTDGVDEFPAGSEYEAKGWGKFENWNRSSVWYAYIKEGNTYKPVAEIARELVFTQKNSNVSDGSPASSPTGAFYQVVTVYPMTTGQDEDFKGVEGEVYSSHENKPDRTNLRKGKIVQVLKDDNGNTKNLHTKEAGANIAMYYSYEMHDVTDYKVPVKPSGAIGTTSQGTFNQLRQKQASCQSPYVYLDLITPTITGNSGNPHDNYLYVKYTINDDNTTTLEPIEDPDKEGKIGQLITLPYIVTDDADNNEYPVVKIGSSYWLGENLRTKKFADGSPIGSSENASKSKQDFDPYKNVAVTYDGFDDCKGNMKAAALNPEDATVSVYMYESQPGYKSVTIGNQEYVFYNFAAVAGFTSKVTETTTENGGKVKTWTSKDNLPVELNGFPILSTMSLTTRSGHGHFYQTGEQFGGVYKEDINNKIERRLTPKDWHLPSTLPCDPNPFYGNFGNTSNPSVYNNPQSVLFGEYIDDVDYMQFYMNGYLDRAVIDKDGYKWPGNHGNKANSNLSGLSLVALPINGEGSSNNFVDFGSYGLDDCRNAVAYKRNGSSSAGYAEEINYDDISKQYVAPFWTPALWYSGRSMWSKVGKESAIYELSGSTNKYAWLDRFSSGYVPYLTMYYVYSNWEGDHLYLDVFNQYINYEHNYPFHGDNPNYPEHYSTVGNNQADQCYYDNYGMKQTVYYPFYKYLSEQYLPVRCVRDSYPESYAAQPGKKLQDIYDRHPEWNWNSK